MEIYRRPLWESVSRLTVTARTSPRMVDAIGRYDLRHATVIIVDEDNKATTMEPLADERC